MAKFLSIDRTFGPRFPRAVSVVERLALFPRINELVEQFGYGSMNQFMDALERSCGSYRIDPGRKVPSGADPCVLYANHPLGGVDTVSAMQLLLADSKPFKMLTARVVEVPPAAEDYVVPVDPSGRDQAFNGRAMAKVLKSFGRDYSRLFVFPSGLSSRFDVRRMAATDSPWSDAYFRIALRANANLVPMWFSGRCSPTYYLLCLLFGRMGRVALPREFFRPKTQPLVTRIGVPIPAKSTVYFGDQRATALRAASYSLELDTGADTELWSPHTPTNRGPSATYQVSVLAPDAVDRDAVLALRGACLGQDEWSEADNHAEHVLAYAGSRCVACCRILHWNKLNPALLDHVSTVRSVFTTNRSALHSHHVVEFGELCIHPDYDAPGLVDLFGNAVRSAVLGSSDTSIGLGVVCLAGHNPILASAQFEFARRSAPSPLSLHFTPKTPLVGASPHHDFRPEHIRYEQEPTASGLPRSLLNHLAIGARLGPSAKWVQRASRASVLAILSH